VLAAQKDSLRQLSWILGAAILVPILVLGFAAVSGYRTAQTLADRQTLRARDVAQEHATKVFETIDRTIALMEEIVSRTPEGNLRSDEPQLHDRLKRIVAGLPQIKSAWVFDKDGHAIANSLVSPPPQIDFSDRDYFRSHSGKDDGLFVGEVLQPRPPYGGERFFSISRRRSGPDGRFAGVIQISVLPEYFEAFYTRIGSQEGSYYALVRQDGAILARHPASEQPLKINSDGPLARAVAQAVPNGLLTSVSPLDGVERRIAFVRIPDYPIYVMAGAEISAIRAAWLRWFAALLAFGVPATAALIAVILLARRRTGRLYAEASRRQDAEAALRQAQRLETLGQLTGGVAHDFNNLQMIIGGAVQQLRNQPLSDRAQRSVAMIETASKRAVSLTSKLLSFARRRVLAPRVMDIGEYLFEFDSALRQSLRTDISLRYEGIVSGLATSVDPDELEITLINLAVNARDAMPDGGDLVISLTTENFRGGEGPDGLKGEFVVIRFRDTGVGISAENKGRIFEPFFTTKGSGKGTGLGLSQAYGFAKQSGGALIVESDEGKGSTFTLLLPRSSEEAEAAEVEELQSALRLAQGDGALLVEDNQDVAEVATGYLSQLGFRVEHVQNADDALRRLRDATFDFALTDIVMPGGLNGLDLARTLREHHPELPLVLATGYSDKANEALAEGFVLLSKPYSIAALARAIKSVRGQKGPAGGMQDRAGKA
jgi:two-component system, NtrC family, sensor kinase